MYNEGNVQQFGEQHHQQQQQVLITPQPHIQAVSDYGNRVPQLSQDNEYLLNQYAGHYQANIAPHRVQVINNGHLPSSTPQPYYPNQAPVVVQNSYSTLQHQPNYDDVKVEHRGLPQHVVDNINNQYGGISQGNLEPRGFAHPFENNGQLAQTINSLQDQSDHNQQVFVSSTEPSVQQYVSSTPANLHNNIGYVSSTEPSVQHNGYISSTSPNVQHGDYNTANLQQNYVSSTESPIQQNYVSSTQSPVEQQYVSSTPSPLSNDGGYVSSTVPNIQQNYVSSTTESPIGYVSSTQAPIQNQQNYYQQDYPTDVQIIPNGQNNIPQHVTPILQEHVQVTTERSSVNPLLMGLVNYLKNHMPDQYKGRFESMLKPYISTPIGNIVPNFNDGVSSTTPLPVSSTISSIGSSTAAAVANHGAEAYPNNPYLNGDVNINNYNNNQAQLGQEPSKQDYAQNPYVTGEVRPGGISPDYLATGVTPPPDYYTQQNNAQNQLQQAIGGHQQYDYNQRAQDRSDYINVQQANQQEYRGDPNNYDANNNQRRVYYELDLAGYQGNYHNNYQRDTNSQQQGKDGTVFAVNNENGHNLQTPNFYQPIHPNQYPNNPFPNYDQSNGASNNEQFIWNAGDYSAPLDPEGNILVRQLNQTCASFRFNTTNDYEQKDQDVHIWNSGDYTALRAEEQLIRSVNVTCDNFTNDYTNNFTSGFSLWQYCSQCLHSDAQDVNNVQTEVIIGPDGQKHEFTYSKTQEDQIYNSNVNGGSENYNYEDPRSNAEIAGIVKVYNPNYTPQEYQNKLQAKVSDNFATLFNNFNAELNRRKPIYVPNYDDQSDEDYDYANNGNGVAKRNTENNDRKYVVIVKKPNNA